MVKTGGMCCIKVTLFIFNLVCVFVSLGIIMTSLIIKWKGKTFFADRDDISMTVVVILLGCFVFVVSLLGVCATLKEVPWALSAYGIILLTLFVIQITCLIYVSVHHRETDAFLKKAMRKGLVHWKSDYLNGWDRIQTHWDCCGLDGPGDYGDLGADMPSSCCAKSTSGVCSKDKAFGKGCYTDLFNYMTSFYFGVGALIALAEFTGMVFSFRLLWDAYSEKRKQREKRRSTRPSYPY